MKPSPSASQLDGGQLSHAAPLQLLSTPSHTSGAPGKTLLSQSLQSPPGGTSGGAAQPIGCVGPAAKVSQSLSRTHGRSAPLQSWSIPSPQVPLWQIASPSND